jgi:hypothetical protein
MPVIAMLDIDYANSIVNTFTINPGRSATLVVPNDLTDVEAERIVAIVRAIGLPLSPGLREGDDHD